MEFSNFIPSYVTSPELKELPLLVLSAVNAFAVKHPQITYPTNFSRLVVLTTHIEEYVVANAKNSEPFSLFFFAFQLIHFLAALLTATKRSEAADTNSGISQRTFENPYPFFVLCLTGFLSYFYRPDIFDPCFGSSVVYLWLRFK